MKICNNLVSHLIIRSVSLLFESLRNLLHLHDVNRSASNKIRILWVQSYGNDDDNNEWRRILSRNSHKYKLQYEIKQFIKGLVTSITKNHREKKKREKKTEKRRNIASHKQNDKLTLRFALNVSAREQVFSQFHSVQWYSVIKLIKSEYSTN